MEDAKKLYANLADDGKNIFSNLIATKDLQVKKWQRIAFLMVGVTVLSTAGMIYTATRSTFIPYVIQVDQKTGFAQSLGSLKEVDRKATPVEVNYFLSRFVENIRSIPQDNYLLQERVNQALNFLTPEATNKFKGLYLKDFTAQIGTGSNRVEVLSVTPVTNTENTYQARWKEKFIPIGSTITQEKMYSGIFTIEEKNISDKNLLKINPLGIFITDFNISEEGGK